VGASRRPVHLLASAGAGRHQLAGRVGHPLRRYPPQGLGRQPHLGGGAGAVGADVGVADLLAPGAPGPGRPEPTPAGHSRGPRPRCATPGGSRGWPGPSPRHPPRASSRGPKASSASPPPLIRCARRAPLLFKNVTNWGWVTTLVPRGGLPMLGRREFIQRTAL